MKKNEKDAWKIWAVTIFLFALVVVATIRVSTLPVLNFTAPGSKAHIVLDPGHGGFDPGKVGTAGTLEKDINLAISLKLKEILVKSGYTVTMTRQKDEALCEENASRKKVSDLNARLDLIQKEEPELTVSIHQNSYSAGTKGAQVFYYSQSEDGHRLARVLQETLKEEIGDGNHRVEKANDSYYMLKKSQGPFVIVECGFLSNPEEEKLLNSEDYQKKMAKALAEGIEKFLYND
ncbi:MAG: N-acetylmuramoyl-L-alanine amidase [Clostridiales bacterium]|nr:N-acetylmuramoyl-L-alanine amidase [Clostridiales bacterium]